MDQFERKTNSLYILPVIQTINECEVKLNNNIRIHNCTCILMEDHLTSKLKKMGQTVNRSKTVDGERGCQDIESRESTG